MWLMLQQKSPDDYIVSTGNQITVKDFVNKTAKKLGIILKWKGKGLDEKAFNVKNKIVIECKKKYFRPTEVWSLLGDSTKAKKILKWKQTKNLDDLITDMIDFRLNKIK